jgi:hypothetical protein
MFKWLARLFGSNPIKIAGLIGAVATGSTLIASGQTEVGIGIIMAGISSNTAVNISKNKGVN